ncbi:hypothetical protein CYMTET_25821 [Cymbomonas tetramitiformis]|uniref:EF-hand domain-containing protein n=1 Tax=Cymbomonas tetramitiformis TaxID=36881 RepID=A0AAE0FT36_9CHLO|nr:hypothetical protein CYMTET_25821 [Cymbomonas tetramitiformis]
MPSFQQLDTDKNGCITLDEYGIALRLIEQISGDSSLQITSTSSEFSSDVSGTTASAKHAQFAEHSKVFNKSQIGAPRRRLVEDDIETIGDYGDYGGYSEVDEASAPPPPPPSSPLPSSHPLLTVVSGLCQTSSEGTCLQSPNYPENYNNRDKCEVSIDGEGVLHSLSFHVEERYDFFYVGSTPYDGREGPNGQEVDSSVVLRFTSDEGDVRSGFEVCVSPRPPPSPRSPPSLPPHMPSPPPIPPAPPLDTNGTMAFVALSEYAQSHLEEGKKQQKDILHSKTPSGPDSIHQMASTLKDLGSTGQHSQ